MLQVSVVMYMYMVFVRILEVTCSSGAFGGPRCIASTPGPPPRNTRPPPFALVRVRAVKGWRVDYEAPISFSAQKIVWLCECNIFL